MGILYLSQRQNTLQTRRESRGSWAHQIFQNYFSLEPLPRPFSLIYNRLLDDAIVNTFFAPALSVSEFELVEVLLERLKNGRR